MARAKSPADVRSTIIAANASVSGKLRHEFMNGLVVIPLAGWTAADIVFELLIGSTWYPLNNESGVRVRIAGVAADEANIAPAEVWALGRFDAFRLVSVAVGTETPVNQASARTITVAMLQS